MTTIRIECATCDGTGEVDSITGPGGTSACPMCAGDGFLITGDIPLLDDMNDKLDDIMDKCDDIFEKVNE